MTHEPEAATDDRKSGKSTLVKILVVGGILVVEAAVIIGAMVLLSGPPEVEASNVKAALHVAEDDKIVEILVLDAKLPNNKTGITYLYDAEIYVQVKKRYEVRVREELSQFRNEIKSQITAIWRTCDPRDFQEPKLQSLTRKVGALLTDRFGVDQQLSEPIMSKCVIVMGTGFRVDA